MLATLHFFLALSATIWILGSIVAGDALVAFGVGIVALIFGGLSLGAGVGLWRLRPLAGRLATWQGFFLLAVGFSVAMYAMVSWGDASGVVAMVPGLVLLLLAGFIRSRRSLVVCSDAYRDALAEVSHTRT